MAQTKNAIIFTGSLGSSDPIYGADRNISADYNYQRAKIDGTDSYYVVYREPDYFDYHSHSESSSKIVDQTSDVTLGFPARSTQGWDKTGITLFEHHYYCGTARHYVSSNPDITDEFPSGDPGASAIIVTKGYWGLYTDKNYKGVQIAINGQKEFGPGTKINSLGAAEDRVKSIKYIKEN